MIHSSSALLTDHYELTMLAAALRDGTASRRCAFEVFARGLPAGRRYGVVAGTGRLLELLTEFRFGDNEIASLAARHVVDAATLAHLSRWRFTGDVWGYGEGETFFPGSPVLAVEGTFADCVLLETLLLSVLNHDCAVAAAAARMVTAAAGRPLLEMGSRRTHEQAAVAAARAAYLVGFDSSSNLEAGRRHGVPTGGTSAHAFTLLHDDERAAFTSQLAALTSDTTLLVDTYDVDDAVRLGVELSGGRLGAVRIDSGNLPDEARRVRRLLDSLGAHRTRIVVSGDLDEFSIAALSDVPIDAYGVGTSLVTGSGAPTAGLVYKLVARQLVPDGELAPVAKRSPGKEGRGGRTAAVRLLTAGVAVAEQLHLLAPGQSRVGLPGDPTHGAASRPAASAEDSAARAVAGESRAAEVTAAGRAAGVRAAGVGAAGVGAAGVGAAGESGGAEVTAAGVAAGVGTAAGATGVGAATGSAADREGRAGRALLRPLVVRGEVVGAEPLADARARHTLSLAELPPAARDLSPGPPALPVLR